MLGQTIKDPNHIESSNASINGLGLLDIETTLCNNKQLRNVRGRLNLDGNPTVSGYEIHMGISKRSALSKPLIDLTDTTDGVISDDRKIVGTYLHGIFDEKEACDALLHWAGLKQSSSLDYKHEREKQIDRIADLLEKQLESGFIEKLLLDQSSLQPNLSRGSLTQMTSAEKP